MKWFYRWLTKKMHDANNDKVAANQIVSKAEASIESLGMTFTVFRANGGTIVETRKYDRKRDSTDRGLHIITDDKDLGEELGKIITYENLKA